MCITILSENSVLQDNKLLTWEGGINCSFTEEKNIKGVLNDFLNLFKYVFDQINI